MRLAFHIGQFWSLRRTQRGYVAFPPPLSLDAPAIVIVHSFVQGSRKKSIGLFFVAMRKSAKRLGADINIFISIPIYTTNRRKRDFCKRWETLDQYLGIKGAIIPSGLFKYVMKNLC